MALCKVIPGPVFAEVSMKNRPFLGHGWAECQPVALQGIGRPLSCMLGSVLFPAYDQHACIENEACELTHMNFNFLDHVYLCVHKTTRNHIAIVHQVWIASVLLLLIDQPGF